KENTKKPKHFTLVGFPPRPELFHFHGISMTHYFTDNWESIQTFQARPDDILIVSNLKLVRNTWVSYILELLHFGQTSVSLYQRVPNWEITIHTLKLFSIKQDHVVSYFHFDYLQRFMDGKMELGSWYDHVSNICYKFCCFLVSFSMFPGMDFNISSFVRKEQWYKTCKSKILFHVTQKEQFEEECKRKMKDPTLQFRSEVYRTGLPAE
uniref:Sulfotransferase n=1 Tax=Mola mola TaxID=94237 RepID=A0A3Q3XQQ1_MOLML